MHRQNEAMVERLTQAFYNGNHDVIDQLVAEDFMGYNPLFREHIQGPKGLKAFFAAIHKAIPDASHPSWLLISDDDLVAIHTPLEGSFSHDLLGVSPNHEKVVLWMANIYRIVDDKITEAWFTIDTLGLMPQLGLMPFAAQPGSPLGDEADMG